MPGKARLAHCWNILMETTPLFCNSQTGQRQRHMPKWKHSLTFKDLNHIKVGFFLIHPLGLIIIKGQIWDWICWKRVNRVNSSYMRAVKLLGGRKVKQLSVTSRKVGMLHPSKTWSLSAKVTFLHLINFTAPHIWHFYPPPFPPDSFPYFSLSLPTGDDSAQFPGLTHPSRKACEIHCPLSAHEGLFYF